MNRRFKRAWKAFMLDEIMADEEWAKRFGDCYKLDCTNAHLKADAILLTLLECLGYEKTVEAWEKVLATFGFDSHKNPFI